MSHVFTGTATDYADLLNKLRAHLTSTDMGPEAWVEVGYDATSVANERFVYLQGPGLAGQDQVHVNIRQYRNPGSDYYNWQIRGSVNYNPLMVFSQQPGTSPAVTLTLWQSDIPYTLVANGRRFILVAKISTTYHTLYAGFILPYATSDEMPYPMYIAASSNLEQVRWSRGTYEQCSPWDPCQGGAYMRHFDGAWVQIFNFYSRSDTVRQEDSANNVWPWEADYQVGQNLDGSYGTLPAIVHGNYSGGNVYGELDGVVFCSGTANASEDTLTIGSDTYLMVQSVYRTNRRDYAAIKLV